MNKIGLMRFILVERQFRMKGIPFVFLIILLIIGLRLLDANAAQKVKLQEEKALVLQIAQMQKAIKEQSDKKVVILDPPKLKRTDLTLTGTTVKQGRLYALINGEILTQGDSIESYTIIEIAMGKAILENKQTNEIRSLYFIE